MFCPALVREKDSKSESLLVVVVPVTKATFLIGKVDVMVEMAVQTVVLLTTSEVTGHLIAPSTESNTCRLAIPALPLLFTLKE